MAAYLSRQISLFFGKFGYEIRRRTPSEQFLKLVSMLWPFESQFELIRIGGDGDGSYLIPNCLKGDEFLISPGVGDNFGFELDMCNRFGTKAILVDPTIKIPDNLPKSFKFIDKYLNVFDDENNVTLESLIEGSAQHKKLVVQMDIEGNEYKILQSLNSKIYQQIKILIVEFHNLGFWRNKIFFEQVVEPAFERVLENFTPVHLKPNTAVNTFSIKGFTFPDAIEVTFLHNSESIFKSVVNSLPHALDVPNSKSSSISSFPKI